MSTQTKIERVMSRFITVKLDKTAVVEKEGMEISAYIAGVNSGMYEFPFVISVKTWARKWFWRKFFVCKMELSYEEARLLCFELQKAVEWHEKKREDGK